MVKTVILNTEIPANRELRITLPEDVPTGSAAIIVTVSFPGPSTAPTFGDLLSSAISGCGAIKPTLKIPGSSPANCGQWVGSGPLNESCRHRRSGRLPGWNRSSQSLAGTTRKGIVHNPWRCRYGVGDGLPGSRGPGADPEIPGYFGPRRLSSRQHTICCRPTG